MEAYIGKCLDSLLIPEFEEVEVLVINDGSKDRSSEIAHSFAERYPDSIRVIDKPNGNYGSCINAALPLCTGRYVKVLDADDTFDTSAFSKFVRKIREIDVDVIFTKCKQIDESGKFLSVSGFTSKDVNMDCIYQNVQDTLGSSILMHWITYNKKVFNRFKYFQPEGISYTDNIWAFVPMTFCKTGIFYDIVLYRYLVGRAGQTVGVDQMKKSINHFSVIARCMIDYYLQISANNLLRPVITKNCVSIVTYVYNLIMRFQSPETIDILRALDEEIMLKAPEIYRLIGEYPIAKSIDYKIYKHLRDSNYSPSFRVPSSIVFRQRMILRKNAFIKRSRNLLIKIKVFKS